MAQKTPSSSGDRRLPRGSRRAFLTGAAASAGALALGGRAAAQTGEPQPTTSQRAAAPTATGEHIVTFRYDELVLLIQGPPPPPIEPDYSIFVTGFLKDLRMALLDQTVNVQLADQDQDLLRYRGSGNQRQLIAINRTGGGDASISYILLTVNLKDWAANLEDKNQQGSHNPQLDTPTRAVTEAVKRINNAPPITFGNYTVTAASPNWLAQSFDFGWDGSPGGRPIPMAAAAPRYRAGTNIDEIKALAGGEAMGDKFHHVAILDTWPVDPAAPFDPLARIREQAALNPRLRQILADPMWNSMTFDNNIDAAGLPRSSFGSLHRNGTSNPEQPYDKSCHGLFVADIINDIAPNAPLHVYRVLDDDGVGDLFEVARAMQLAIDAARTSGYRLVLNLSLGLAPEIFMVGNLLTDPVDGQEKNAWWARLRQYNPNTLLQSLVDDGLFNPAGLPTILTPAAPATSIPPPSVDAGFTGALKVIDLLFTIPSSMNVFVVAAAGNDSDGSSVPFPPRMPAAVESVLAVSSRSQLGTGLSVFSNADDQEPERFNGISAIAGDTVLQADGNTVTTGGPAALFISDFPDDTPGGMANTTGYATWAGTSFAAPIVTGLALCIWSSNPDKTPLELMQKLLRDDTGAHREIDLRQM